MTLLGVIGLVAAIAVGVTLLTRPAIVESEGPVTVVAQSSVVLGSIYLLAPGIPDALGLDSVTFGALFFLTFISTAYIDAYQRVSRNAKSKPIYRQF